MRSSHILLGAVYDVIQDLGGAKVVGAGLTPEKPGAVLSHEIAGQAGAKLGATTLLQIAARDPSHRIAHAFASALNGVYIPPPAVGSEHACALAALAALAKESGEAVCKTASAVADGKVTTNELNDITRECLDAMQALAHLMHAAQALHVRGRG